MPTRVFFVSGDADALRAARRARVLVATARELDDAARGRRSSSTRWSGAARTTASATSPGELDPPPRVVVTTSGSLGGWAQPGGPYRAAPIPGSFEDAYGCGDCFAAGLAFALGEEQPLEEALAFGAACGAAALSRRGALGPVEV